MSKIPDEVFHDLVSQNNYIKALLETIKSNGQPLILTVEDDFEKFGQFFRQVFENLRNQGWKIPDSNILCTASTRTAENILLESVGHVTPFFANTDKSIKKLIGEARLMGIPILVLEDMNIIDMFDKKKTESGFTTFTYLNEVFEMFEEDERPSSFQMLIVTLSERKASEVIDMLQEFTGIEGISVYDKNDVSKLVKAVDQSLRLFAARSKSIILPSVES